MKFIITLIAIAVVSAAVGVIYETTRPRIHQSMVCFTASTRSGTQWGNRVVTNPNRNPFVTTDDIEWMRSEILADTNITACVIVSITPLR